jgi:hypothetical protein
MLMLRALDGPLSDSERAWACHHLGNMLACTAAPQGRWWRMMRSKHGFNTYFIHARVAVWQMTGDRGRTLDLLRHARDTADRDFIGDFRFHREFLRR